MQVDNTKNEAFKLSISFNYKDHDISNSEVDDILNKYNAIFSGLKEICNDEIILNVVFSRYEHLINFIKDDVIQSKFRVKVFDENSENCSKINFLKEKVNKRIDSFKERRNYNRANSIRIKFMLLFITSLTTITLGINGVKDSEKVLFQNVAFLFSSITTFVTSWDTFFNYRGLWVKYTVTLNDLYKLRDDLEYLDIDETRKNKAEDIENLYKVYQEILEETNRNWNELRKETKSL